MIVPLHLSDATGGLVLAAFDDQEPDAFEDHETRALFQAKRLIDVHAHLRSAHET